MIQRIGNINKERRETMKISDIPYDMKFIFGPNLREVPVSKIQMLNGMIYIMEQLKGDQLSEEEKGEWNGILGYYLRIVGELEESEKHLKASIRINNHLSNQQAVFINKLRLAHTYQWWTNYEVSNEMFRDLLEKAETDSDFSHFLDHVYDHFAKNLFDQKDFPTALSYFKKSLDLRLEKNNSELISLSETAIEACEYRIEHF